MTYDEIGHASPELDEGPAEGRGEPKTIERPRIRTRLADQGELARPPGEGGRRDPYATALARGNFSRAVDALGGGSTSRR